LSSQDYNHIVRIVGNDIPGERKIIIGLTQIKGIGYNFATAILDSLKINPNSNVGYLSDSDVQAIEKLITDPSSSNFPSWFLNRRKDVETGKDMHLLTSDIDFALRNDIERERITNSWRGYRHLYGLKVRGQRTRCTGRKGGAVGVAKGGKAAPAKTAAPKAVAAPTGEAAPAAPAKKEEAAEKKE
jgi:small subunit ribosomal protein S13